MGRVPSCIVDQAVNSTKALNCHGDQILDIVFLGDVTGHKQAGSGTCAVKLLFQRLPCLPPL
uniref:Uncharacterized protein n=1 Tax=Anguilla anguilla TaxID=7936 RepID=A0A0E9V9R1_ANGAN